MSPLDRLNQALASSELEALIISAGPTMYYLTGLHFHVSERPVMAVFRPDRTPVLILPELEQSKAEDTLFKTHAYGEGEESMREGFHQALGSLSIHSGAVGVESLHLRFLESSLLERSLPGAQLVAADALITGLRMIKDGQEIASIKSAVGITEQAIRQTLSLIRAGMSELELASEISLQLLRAGSEPKVPFNPIVASGPNSALPHASPSKRTLARGDLLIIDCGATSGGYVADLTRSFAVGEPEAELVKIHAIVWKANRAGREAAGGGVACQSVDQAARAVIEAAGYGQFFTHRTGHGIGLEGHEGPYLDSSNELLLGVGMTFTVEPGVYLPQRGGVRIEDNLVITPDGTETMSNFPRDLQVVG